MGSISQYSLTPNLAYISRLTTQSRAVDDGEIISTTRSGAALDIGVRNDIRVFIRHEYQVGLQRNVFRKNDVERREKYVSSSDLTNVCIGEPRFPCVV